MTGELRSTSLWAVKSLRCVCGHVLSAQSGAALLHEVERHLDQMLAHAELLGIERVAQLHDDARLGRDLACDHDPNNEEEH